MKTFINKISALLFIALFIFAAPQALARHALAMHGTPLYKKDFTHFSYVNAHAPKGGRVRLSRIGSFDSLNPLITIGAPVHGVREFVYESLLVRSLDEPFTLYGLLARDVEVAADRSWVAFTLNDKAKFSDGTPVRVEDIIFSAKTLRDGGRPNHRFYYRKIAAIEKTAPARVKFTFIQNSNWEMPLIIGLMPIISERHFNRYDFSKSRTRLPLGSGPYRLSKMALGKYAIYTRNKNYWGKNLAVNRGRFNFDEMMFEYYRDENTNFQAFKAGHNDVREEYSPKRWAQEYDFPAMQRGEISKILFPLKTPASMWAMVFNTRKALFADRRVRQALMLSFDGAWINKNLFYGLWQRTDSFWARSDLSSSPAPVPRQSARQVKRQVIRLFQEAGWGIRDNKMTHGQRNEVFRFEILTKLRQNERIALVWRQQLKRFGIEVNVRFVDDSQYQRQRQNYDFDMIFARWFLSLSPGNEQAFYWGSQAAAQPASRNYPGIRSAEIDRLIAQIANAKTRSDLVRQTRALDRALLAGIYMIPLFHQQAQWVATKNHLGWPQKTSFYGFRIENWWVK